MLRNRFLLYAFVFAVKFTLFLLSLRIDHLTVVLWSVFFIFQLRNFNDRWTFAVKMRWISGSWYVIHDILVFGSVYFDVFKLVSLALAYFVWLLYLALRRLFLISRASSARRFDLRILFTFWNRTTLVTLLIKQPLLRLLIFALHKLIVIYKIARFSCLWIFAVIFCHLEELLRILLVTLGLCSLLAWAGLFLEGCILKLALIVPLVWLGPFWCSWIAVFLSFLVLDNDFTPFLFDLVKKLLGMTPYLGTWSRFYEFLDLLPVFAVESKSYSNKIEVRKFMMHINYFH